MFISCERRLAVDFPAAATRLARLPDGSWFRAASETAYRDGVEYLMRVGPVGAVPGASRLVRIRFTEPACRDGMMTVGLRWEATGRTGGLFPVLDADIRLCDDDDVCVTLTGSYRPPLGTLGAGLDRLLLRNVATATLRTLLTWVADVLEGMPPETAVARQIDPPWQPDLGREPTSI